MNLRLVALALGLAVALGGCPTKSDPTPSGAAIATSTPADAENAPPSVAMDFIARFDDCTTGHLGPLIDLGDRTARASFGLKLNSALPQSVEREGGTWTRVTSRAMSLTFVLDGAEGTFAEPVVMARVRGGSARSVSVYLNDRPVGQWVLAKGLVRVVEARGAEAALMTGTNQLQLRFNGAGRASAEDLAEIDWIHVGSGAPEGAYAAPTRADVLVSATVGGIPKRSVSLRAPGYARCTGVLPSGGRLEADVGLAGATDGEVEVKPMRDRQPPATLATIRLTAADANAWKTVRVPLGDLGEKAALGAVALVAKSVTKGGRVLFAEPRVVTSAGPTSAPRTMPASRGVVLVILGDVSPRGLALYGGSRMLPELGALAAAGVTFDAQRATTTVPPGAVASMLTGLDALAHGVSEYDRKLPANVTTIADAARQGGVVAAMLTANPLTGSAFGFDRAWETYEMHPPADDAPGTAVFDRAAQFIERHKSERFLVVIHARGGHPPWDISADELKNLAPEGYTGGIDPKHAAELLGKARRVPPMIRYAEQDRARTWALYDTALAAHDAALGRLMAALRASGRDGDTTIMVTSDVSVDEAAHVPFGEGESLDEAPLRVPLVVRPPTDPRSASFSGKRVAVPTSGADLARSILGALGLAAPGSFQGMDLWEATARASEGTRPLLATLGLRFSMRWGSFVLSGGPEKEPKLCNLSLEPVCATDVRATHPLATEAIQRESWDELMKFPVKPVREAPQIDAAAAAALKAWGR